MKPFFKSLVPALLLGVQVVFAQTIWDGTADTDWYNSSDTKFTITTPEQLAGLAELVNEGNDFAGKTVELGANIVLNDVSNWEEWDENTTGLREWTAIGMSDDIHFRGIFDGDGHVVSGVYINKPNVDNQGLFGYAASFGTIKNLGVIASYVRGYISVGGLVGYYRGVISNSYATGNVVGNENVGGLVGDFFGTISNSYSTGKVSGVNRVGGLVGRDNNSNTTITTIYNSYFTGEVTGVSAFGDLVGLGYSARMNNCYYNEENNAGSGGVSGVGMVLSDMKTEAFVKTLNSWVLNQDEDYFHWALDNGTNQGYPIIVYEENEDVNAVKNTRKSLWDAIKGENTKQSSIRTNLVLGVDGLEGTTIAWASSNASVIAANGTVNRPVLEDGNASVTLTATISKGDFSVEVKFELIVTKILLPARTPDISWYNDDDSVFEISNEDQLAGLAELTRGGNNFAGKIVTLCSDIDLSSYGADSELNDNKGWIPIGQFNGIFNGKGKEISGLYINDPALNDAGLFGRAGGTIKNVGVVDVDIVGGTRVGSIVGGNRGATIANSYSTGEVAGQTNVGGMFGEGWGTIVNSYSTVTVRGTGGDNIGGLVGWNGGTITNSYTAGEVTGRYNLGGIAGGNSGTISSSYWNTDGGRSNSVGTSSGTTTAIGLDSDEMKDEDFVELLNSWVDENQIYFLWTINTSLNQGYPILVYEDKEDPIETCLIAGKIWENDECRDKTDKEVCEATEGSVWVDDTCKTNTQIAQEACLADGKVWENDECRAKTDQELCEEQADMVWENNTCKPKTTSIFASDIGRGRFETHPYQYYNLRGQPLGTQKPTTPGVYIEYRKGAIKRIVVH
ncbi:MAG: hypothetical protein LBU89_10200 [Fibromonadaceae bacterium]|jgi:hypothetical protein|nr:hypothetical protein [Fibromonadaceae bacterium]